MSKVYRKVALERLSSPEQLDQLMEITRPQGWLALAALVLLTAAAVVWGFVGSIPTEALGEGILLRQGGVSQVVAAGSGQLEEILVAVGDTVEAGEVVGRVRQETAARELADLEIRRGELEAEHRDLQLYAEEQQRLAAAGLGQERANLERSVATAERRIEILEEQIRVQQELHDQGLVTRQVVLDLEQEANAARDVLAGHRLALEGLDLRRLEERQALDQQLEESRGALRDLELRINARRSALEESVHVVSPSTGRVLEVLADRGDVVGPGTPILTMEVATEELVAVLFVPAALGKQVVVDMEARVVPSTVQREKYGFMVGRVVRVAEFPSTSRGMERLLANRELVEDLMVEGPPIRVDVRLERDASTPSGFAWSSSRGPEHAITSGTLAAGSVIVREDRPVSLVIPEIRERLGI